MVIYFPELALSEISTFGMEQPFQLARVRIKGTTLGSHDMQQGDITPIQVLPLNSTHAKVA